MKKTLLLMVLFIVFTLTVSCGDNTRKPVNDSEGADNDSETQSDTDNETGDDVEQGDCGNGSVEGSEECDGGLIECTELNPALYLSGKAKCKEDCSGWDTVTCVESDAVCGDDVTEAPEVCDGDLKNCVEIDSSKYKGGKAKCNRNCDGYDTVTCEELDDYCGNGEISFGEICDKDVTDCTVLDSKLYSGGNATCKDDCSGYDVSQCVEIVAVCGDEKVEGSEICEKEELINCIEIDPSLYKGGKAYCLDDCSGWDVITCEENTGILFSDGFENGDAKWTLGGDWEIGLPYYDIGGVTLNEAAAGEGVLGTKLTDGYTVNVNSTATISDEINIPATGSYELSFSAYVNTDFDTDSTTGKPNWFDGMVVTYKSGSDAETELILNAENIELLGTFKALTDGTNYAVKTGLRGTSVNNTYSGFSSDLSFLAGETVTISFVFYSDTIQGGTGSFPGIYIDDVMISLK